MSGETEYPPRDFEGMKVTEIEAREPERIYRFDFGLIDLNLLQDQLIYLIINRDRCLDERDNDGAKANAGLIQMIERMMDYCDCAVNRAPSI